MRALRCFLGVNRYAAKAGMEGELGWVSPHIRRCLNMVRLWNRILNMKKTRLPRIIFDYQHSHNLVNSWLKDVKTIFSMVNCTDVFENNLPIVNLKSFINYAREKLMQVHASTWSTEVANKPKLYMLAQYKKNIILQRNTAVST